MVELYWLAMQPAAIPRLREEMPAEILPERTKLKG
jgi:hypothetical protein